MGSANRENPGRQRSAIVGGGPAGLMAAEVLLQSGHSVDLYDAMPSVGRKFLLAGKGGLNLTHSEDFHTFVERYRTSAAYWQPRLQRFGAPALREWAAGLGVASFVGSSGRVFPEQMKSAPLLRSWLQRLRAQGLRIHPRHRLTGVRQFHSSGPSRNALQFSTPAGAMEVTTDAILLALGGASWPQLGSDGAWVAWLAEKAVSIAPLRPANCGFDVQRVDGSGNLHSGWSAHFRERHAGAALKNVALRWTAAAGRKAEQLGEFVITNTGVEGSLIYAASADIRDTIAEQGAAIVQLDLLAQRSAGSVTAALSKPRGSRSLATYLKACLGLAGQRSSLLYELLPRALLNDPRRLAAAVKCLPLRLSSARPVAEAISTAGGVRLDAIDQRCMLKALPGVFCAGEMLDWEAPTGGYLLTACFSSGLAAGEGIDQFLRQCAT